MRRSRIAHAKFAERAFIAGCSTLQEDSGNSVDTLDGSVDPGAIHLSFPAVDPQASLAIVQTGQNDVRPGEQAESAVLHHICGQRSHESCPAANPGRHSQPFLLLSGRPGLNEIEIARERFGGFDGIEINDDDV